MPLTAGTPLDVLTDRLQRAGWGDLGSPTLRGLTRVLDALASCLDPKTGTGKTTANQLAEKTCYTERWVRRCLGLLEDLDLVEWHRGGIVGGKPTPSWIRVSKAALVDLIHIARRKQGEKLDAARVETRRRVAALRTSYTRRGRTPRDRKRARTSSPPHHAELGSALLSIEEVSTARRAAGGVREGEKDDAPASKAFRASMLARIRADMAAQRGHRSPKSAAIPTAPAV